jgi:hypothetical protein
MIAAPVFVRHPSTGEAAEESLGVFEFLQLPAPSDGFNILHDNGRVARYRVLRVMHEPLRVGQTCDDPDRFSAFVFVVFIDEHW